MAYMLEGIDWRNPQLTFRPNSAGCERRKKSEDDWILGRHKSRET